MYMVWNGPVYAHAFPMQTVEAVEERETAKERDRNDRKGWKRSRARLREREREKYSGKAEAETDFNRATRVTWY